MSQVNWVKGKKTADKLYIQILKTSSYLKDLFDELEQIKNLKDSSENCHAAYVALHPANTDFNFLKKRVTILDKISKQRFRDVAGKDGYDGFMHEIEIMKSILDASEHIDTLDGALAAKSSLKIIKSGFKYGG